MTPRVTNVANVANDADRYALGDLAGLTSRPTLSLAQSVRRPRAEAGWDG
jgi:hypothetical protein